MKLTRNRVLGGVGVVVLATTVAMVALFSSGGPTVVPAGANLQEYINAAATGDTLQLSGTYVGNFTENKGLIIQGPGTIRTPNTQWAIYYPPRTPKATLRNLTVTVTIGGVNDIVRHGSGDGPRDTQQDSLDEVPQGLTLENVDITGLPGLEIKRGVTANGANLVIRNSKIREIHGKGYDTQAVCGWNGPGPVLIEDSYLEAAGENVMFGGADPSIPNLVPSDIAIRRTHFFKPLAWKGVWTVKNLFETKNARRLVIDGNVFENVWPDAQVGFAILIKSNNQDSTAPWSVTEDLVFSNNVIKGAEHGLNILGVEYPPKVSGVTKRIRISNNFWDVKRIWLQVVRGGEDIQLDHNTYVSASSGEFTQISFDEIAVKGFVLNNNLGNKVGYGIKGSGSSEGKPTLDTWCPGWAMAGNVMAGTGMQVYPTSNSYPASLTEVGFVDMAGSNYRLSPSSPYKGKATDGKDPGVDWDMLTAAQMKPVATPTITPVSSPTPVISPASTPISSPSPIPASPSPTLVPVPSPSPSLTPTPRPSPALPACAANQIIGNPARCLCTTGVRCTGSNARCL